MGFVAIALVTLGTLSISLITAGSNKPARRAWTVFVWRTNSDLRPRRVERFIVPVIRYHQSSREQQFLQPRIEEERMGLAELQQEISMEEQEIVDLETSGEQALDGQGAQEPASDEQGIVSSTLGGLNRLLSSVTGAVDDVLPDISMPNFSQITSLRESAVEYVQGLTELLVLIAIKNIVLPLVFLAIAVKGTVPIAKWLMRVSAAHGGSRALTTV